MAMGGTVFASLKTVGTGKLSATTTVPPWLSGKEPAVGERPRTHGPPPSLVCRKAGPQHVSIPHPQALAWLCDNFCDSEAVSPLQGVNLALHSAPVLSQRGL